MLRFKVVASAILYTM